MEDFLKVHTLIVYLVGEHREGQCNPNTKSLCICYGLFCPRPLSVYWQLCLQVAMVFSVLKTFVPVFSWDMHGFRRVPFCNSFDLVNLILEVQR